MAKIYYKNVGLSTKTYYGTEFASGEIKSVPDYINDVNFVRCSEEDFKAAQPVVAVKVASKPGLKPKSSAAPKDDNSQEAKS